MLSKLFPMIFLLHSICQGQNPNPKQLVINEVNSISPTEFINDEFIELYSPERGAHGAQLLNYKLIFLAKETKNANDDTEDTNDPQLVTIINLHNQKLSDEGFFVISASELALHLPKNSRMKFMSNMVQTSSVHSYVRNYVPNLNNNKQVFVALLYGAKDLPMFSIDADGSTSIKKSGAQDIIERHVVDMMTFGSSKLK